MFFGWLGMMGGERVAVVSSGCGADGDDGESGRAWGGRCGCAGYAGGDMRRRCVVWDYHDVAERGAGAEVVVRVKGLPAGVKRALVEQYRIDGTHSNAYTVWKAMGSPQSPTAEQVAALKGAGELELLGSPAWVDVRRVSVRIWTGMPRQATSLLRICW